MLQFQNQKLLQKLETQKVEINALEDRLCLLRDKQYSYEKTLAVADNSWKEVHKYDAILIINYYYLGTHYFLSTHDKDCLIWFSLFLEPLARFSFVL